jgi:hypothetical protein
MSKQSADSNFRIKGNIMDKEIAVIEKPSQAIINWQDAVNSATIARDMRMQLADKVLKAEVDFGLPYEGAPKKVLLLPGAQKITDAFECYAEPVLLNKVEQWDREAPLFHYHYRVNLRQRGTDSLVSVGEGSANSNEAKWYWRKAQRVCPVCGKSAIIRGKQEFGGGWLCWSKRDGCGAKFKADDALITEQAEGRIRNEDIFDQVNTIQKIAIKRAHVAAAVNFGFSELFTQDLEEFSPEDMPHPKTENGKSQQTKTSSAPVVMEGITEEQQKQIAELESVIADMVDDDVLPRTQAQALHQMWTKATTYDTKKTAYDKIVSEYGKRKKK